MPDSNMPNRDYWIKEADISPNSAAFGRDRSVATMTIDTREDVSTLPDLVKDILGYAKVDPDTDSQIIRYLPWRHPLFRWMVATEIAEMRFFGPVDFGEDNQGKYSLHNNPDDLAAPNCRTTIRFSSMPYDVLNEEQVTDDTVGRAEWKRFTEIIESPEVEFITTERGLMKFAESPAGGLSLDSNGNEVATNISGNPIRQGWTIRWMKSNIRIVWHQVPEDLIYNSDRILTPRITDGIGKVNDAEFMGWPAGTLLAMQPRITPHVEPIPPDFVGVANFVNKVARSYTIEHNWVFTDPPYDPDSTGGPALSASRGWNILPTPLISPEYWVLATRNGETDGQRLYSSYTFSNFFEGGGW